MEGEDMNNQFHIKEFYQLQGEVTYVQDEQTDLPPKIVSFNSNNALRKIVPSDVTKFSETIKAEWKNRSN